MTAPPTASIVIPAYTLQRWEELSAALDAIAGQTVPAHDTIVVVDGNEELRRRVERAFPRVRALPNGREPGASGARNTGAAAARGDVLVLLDDDAIPEPTWLERLLAGFGDPAVLGVGGMLVPLWRARQPRWFPPEFAWTVGCCHPGMRADAGPIRNPICANMAVWRRLYLDAGGFDGSLGRLDRPGQAVSGTAEETEFCIRQSARHPGRHWHYEPAAVAHHVVTPQRTTWRYFIGRCRLEGTAKARLVELAGAQDGLASERGYVTSVLPRAVARELRAAARGDGAALLRAGAIVAGTAATAGAYLRAKAARAVSPAPRSATN